MKSTKILTAALTALTFAIVSCDEKKTTVPHDHDGDGKPDHGPGEHGKKKPIPHDHDGDGIPDHGPGEHGKKKPVPHDHDGDGKPDHGPGAHDHQSGHDHGDHSGHSHAKKIAGPNGGKILTNIEPHAEFFVTADKKVRITFLGDDNKAIAVAAQTVGIVCGDRAAPTTLTLVKEANGKSLLSTGTLPEGNLYPVIATFKTNPDAAPKIARFSLNLNDCSSCIYKEYACTCAHSHNH